MSTPPLNGLKVLEIGHYIAAPFCTRILADLGAEVIKIEPPGGDPFRGWGAAKDGHSVWFSIHGRNKLCIELDLKRQRDTLLQLVARADVLVENLRAGQLERLNIGPEVLHAVNPRLVIARISGYGQDGPYRDKPAFGAIGEAIGGLRHLTAHPGGATELPPPRCGISISDDLAGLYAAIGLLSAVWQRDATGTGRGRIVDVNLVDSVFSLMEGMLPEYAMDGRIRQPAGAAIATASPTNTYPCADGRWLCVAGNSDLIFRRLMAAIGRPELADNPAYATNGLRCQNRDALDTAIAAWTRTLPAKDAEATLEAAEVPCSRLFDIADCAADPHFRARQAVQDVDDPLIGPTLHPGPTIRLDGERPEDVVRWTGPAVGAHTGYVLHTLLGLPRPKGDAQGDLTSA
ncbi:CaiB/BaiF CoA transferase family protein [Rhodopila globiformis]|uniref:Carnitine dehydratase n=1 Tax=Rhodopila globiformis TaxID=1071 RepID=A0A2S6N1V5_RHOGL|nr:CoA transferase [Rhodopila globiformis]PPQ28568.1 carnitine dehydratase [Rhodopila globiformis]